MRMGEGEAKGGERADIQQVDGRDLKTGRRGRCERYVWRTGMKGQEERGGGGEAKPFFCSSQAISDRPSALAMSMGARPLASTHLGSRDEGQRDKRIREAREETDACLQEGLHVGDASGDCRMVERGRKVVVGQVRVEAENEGCERKLESTEGASGEEK